MYVCMDKHVWRYTHTPHVPQRIILKIKVKKVSKIDWKTANVCTAKKHLLFLSGMAREGLLERSFGPEVHFEGKVKFGQAEKS